jgi:subtilisin family serine protease
VVVLAPLTAVVGPAGHAADPPPVVPSRVSESSFAAMSDTDLWTGVADADQTVVVGLKVPGQARGVWKSAVLLDHTEWESARRAVLDQKGVTLLTADPVLPTLVVRVADQATLAAVRGLPVVDYLEPAMVGARSMSSGCGNQRYDPTSQPVHGFEWIDNGGDVLPWNFNHSNITQGWARGGTGAGTTVVVLDTGTYREQTQLWNAPAGVFSAGMGGPRSLSYRNETTLPTYDECGHGTLTAGTIAAPRDRRNIVGVAWQANLRMVKAVDDVWVQHWQDAAIVNGIRTALADRPARPIVAMAFGDAYDHSWIADEIRRQHYRTDLPGGVLFVGAAGTSFCPIWAPVAFPARMPEVVAVTGRAEAGGVHPNTCTGPEVDLAAVVDEVPAPGRYPDDLVHFGGSSDATAVAAGVAAMTWSKYPAWTRDQVRDRMYHTAWGGAGEELGHGVVDAYGATGGFLRVWIDGPTSVEPRDTYTLTARPIGDGPFSYRWSNGATTRDTTLTAGANNTSQRLTVTVTDTDANKTLTATRTVWARTQP